jgi:hypothetical protein
MRNHLKIDFRYDYREIIIIEISIKENEMKSFTLILSIIAGLALEAAKLLWTYIVWPTIKWAIKVIAKVSLYILIKTLEAALDIFVFTFRLIFIETLKSAVRAL